MNLSTVKEKARTWWATNRKDAIRLLLVAGALILLLAAFLRTPGAPAEPQAEPATSQQVYDELDALDVRVAALEAAADPAPGPSPQPPRASAPRAAVRPTSPPAAPAAPAPRWGITDLDRAIAAFPSTKPLEQAK